jgi:hypothetical protein
MTKKGGSTTATTLKGGEPKSDWPRLKAVYTQTQRAKRAAQAKAWRSKNVQWIREYDSAYRKRRRPHFNAQHTRRRRALKQQVLEYYSNGTLACACCGIIGIDFLTLDHKNNDGAAHRKEVNARGELGMYSWARTHGFPPLFRVLCWNCNMARAMPKNKGICPHQQTKQN